MYGISLETCLLNLKSVVFDFLHAFLHDFLPVDTHIAWGRQTGRHWMFQ